MEITFHQLFYCRNISPTFSATMKVSLFMHVMNNLHRNVEVIELQCLRAACGVMWHGRVKSEMVRERVVRKYNFSEKIYLEV